MNAEDIALVQGSFARLSRHTDTLPDLFYSRLFAMNPSLRGMFTRDMADQKRKFLTMLKLVASDLSRPDELLPMVRELGRRHGCYGVTPEHYDQVAVALLWALEVLLDKEFTPRVKVAWSAVYLLLAQTMQEAAENKE